MVVFVGVTACVPPVVASEYVELSALSLMTTLVAFVAVTARVLLPPLATVDGLAVMEIVGAGAAADAVPPPHPIIGMTQKSQPRRQSKKASSAQSLQPAWSLSSSP
jgi:hypothetical protein